MVVCLQQQGFLNPNASMPGLHTSSRNRSSSALSSHDQAESGPFQRRSASQIAWPTRVGDAAIVRPEPTEQISIQQSRQHPLNQQEQSMPKTQQQWPARSIWAMHQLESRSRNPARNSARLHDPSTADIKAGNTSSSASYTAAWEATRLGRVAGATNME
ncbi:hypothetical protein ACLOJK_008030 [Asimina triloba]